MIVNVTLQNLPNQEFSVVIGGLAYYFKLRDGGDFTFVDLSTEHETLIQGIVAMPNRPLIPYRYLERGGNFIFNCINNDYPAFEKFEVSQSLFFLSEDEYATA